MGTRAVQDAAEAHQRLAPGDHGGAAVAAAERLRDADWAAAASELHLSLATYDEWSEAFCLFEVSLRLGRSGEAWEASALFHADALPIEPYRYPHLVAGDALFVFVVLYIGLKELRDTLAHLRMGPADFVKFWGFWNIVDWCSITLSLCVCGLWVDCVLCMRDESFHSLLQLSGGTWKLNQDMMLLSVEQVGELHERLADLRGRFAALQKAMSLTTVVMVLKFFKAFQSNDRLKVVTDTFRQSAVDLVHFFIIFMTIFLPFTMTGHILFGSDIEELGSVFSSINTALMMLMGDFAWYADLGPRNWHSRLPSGMPVVVLFLWYFLFSFMMVLVVLNMLLAIVLEHYIEITNLLKDKADAVPIWVQVRSFIQFKRETRAFLPLEQIARLLERGNEPAHPQEDVTEESLVRAFKDWNMGEEQARWLMDFVRRSLWIPTSEGSEGEEMGPDGQAELLWQLEKQVGALREGQERAAAAALAGGCAPAAQGNIVGQLLELQRGQARMETRLEALVQDLGPRRSSAPGRWPWAPVQPPAPHPTEPSLCRGLLPGATPCLKELAHQRAGQPAAPPPGERRKRPKPRHLAVAVDPGRPLHPREALASEAGPQQGEGGAAPGREGSSGRGGRGAARTGPLRPGQSGPKPSARPPAD